MSNPYMPSTNGSAAQNTSLKDDQAAENMAHETGERLQGPLTGKPVEAEGEKAFSVPKNDRKAASAFRTISEVADILDVQQHVLRFWETKFSQIRPLKRGGGRRYYRPEDLELLKKIHHLLYTEGYTIKGVQKLLKERGKSAVLQPKPAAPQNNNEPKVTTSVKGSLGKSMNARQRDTLQDMIDELKELRALIDTNAA